MVGGLGPEVRAIVADDRLARDSERIAAGTAHRLRTNLTVIGGWAATLDDEWDRLAEERRRSAVRTIRRLVDDVLADAAEVLARARAELDLAELAPVPLDLRAVLDAVDGPVVHLSPPGTDLLALADPAALQQVLGKLLENAVAYSPPGAQVVVAARRNPRAVVVEVRDEGPGMPEGVDVFGPFVRGPGAVGTGHGLGLYVARQLALAMGGDLTADPGRPRGTVVRLHLPVPGTSVISGVRPRLMPR